MIFQYRQTAKEMELSCEKVSARLQPATPGWCLAKQSCFLHKPVHVLCRTKASHLMPSRIFQLQLHTTMSRNLVSANSTVTAPPSSRDLLARGKSRNFRHVNQEISRKELETKTREEIGSVRYLYTLPGNICKCLWGSAF